MHHLNELKSRIDRLFEEAISDSDKIADADPHVGADWSPRVDLWELSDRVIIRADLPGVAAEDLDLRLERGHIILRGRRMRIPESEETALGRLERPFGAFIRRFALPDSIDIERVRAIMRAGVLEIVIRKRESGSERRISVEPGE